MFQQQGTVKSMQPLLPKVPKLEPSISSIETVSVNTSSTLSTASASIKLEPSTDNLSNKGNVNILNNGVNISTISLPLSVPDNVNIVRYPLVTNNRPIFIILQNNIAPQMNTSSTILATSSAPSLISATPQNPLISPGTFTMSNNIITFSQASPQTMNICNLTAIPNMIITTNTFNSNSASVLSTNSNNLLSVPDTTIPAPPPSSNVEASPEGKLVASPIPNESDSSVNSSTSEKVEEKSAVEESTKDSPRPTQFLQAPRRRRKIMQREALSTVSSTFDHLIQTVTPNLTIPKGDNSNDSTVGGRYQCKRCNERFLSNLSLQRHEMQMHNVEMVICSECKKIFRTTHSLNDHKRRVHGDRSYVCKICGMDFNSEAYLKAHTKIHATRQHTCDQCNHSFVNKTDLHNHMRVHTGEKPFQCNVCGKAFRHVSGFYTHVRIHTGENPYKCEFCGKLFTNASNFQSHRKTHTKEKRFTCEECGRGFVQQSNYSRHLRIHTLERPYKCSQCDLSFAYSTALKRHRIKVHGIEPYHCENCRRTYLTEAALVRHRTGCEMKDCVKEVNLTPSDNKSKGNEGGMEDEDIDDSDEEEGMDLK